MKQRIISAIFLLLITIPIVIIGGIPFNGLILLLGIFSLYEMLKITNKIPLLVKLIAYLFISILILYPSSNNFIFEINFNIIISLLLLLFIPIILINKLKDYNYQTACFIFAIILFLGISFNSIIYIRNINIYLLIYLFLITIMTDTFALFIGKIFGKHKLAPDISPNKTIEGGIGGLIFGTITASLFYYFFVSNLNILITIGITLFLSIIGQVGDLIMSSIKRFHKIKDFSNLIPGHGGVLDRFDSIIFVILTYILISHIL